MEKLHTEPSSPFLLVWQYHNTWASHIFGGPNSVGTFLLWFKIINHGLIISKILSETFLLYFRFMFRKIFFFAIVTRVLSDWRPGGRGFNPRRGRQHSFVEIDHEIFSTAILSLPLIQEGQLSVSGERMCTILVNRLED